MNANVRPNAGGWAQIDVACASGLREVKAQISGPFAIHRSLTGLGWSVSHTRTGLAFPCDFLTYAGAASFGKRARKLVSGTKASLESSDYKEVVAALKVFTKTFRKITEECGGEWDKENANRVTDENYRHIQEDTQ